MSRPSVPPRTSGLPVTTPSTEWPLFIEYVSKIQAITAELEVLDDQLEVLERSLVPLQAWSAQWTKVQHTLLHSLDLPEGKQD